MLFVTVDLIPYGDVNLKQTIAEVSISLIDASDDNRTGTYIVLGEYKTPGWYGEDAHKLDYVAKDIDRTQDVLRVLQDVLSQQTIAAQTKE